MMSFQQDDAPEILPQVLHLGDLLKKVRRGEIRVPNFQRDFVWDRQRMLDLFDSVRRQYPIGTLLFWSPPPPLNQNTRPYIGPLETPERDGTLLILDGQQRLTTLAGVLLYPTLAREGFEQSGAEDPQRWRVYFDASGDKGGRFVHTPPLKTEPWIVPVADLLDNYKQFGHVRAIMEAELPETLPSAQELIGHLQSAAAALSSYRIPIVEFVTNDVTLAVESFARLNRQGRTMGPDEMLTALTYKTGDDGAELFNLSKEITRIRESIVKTGFGKVDRVTILRSILVAANLPPYRTDWAKLGKPETQEQLERAAEEALDGLLKAVEFLSEQGIYNIRTLPYAMQLVAIAAFFGRNKGGSQDQKELLARMLWVTSFASWFGGKNPAVVRRLLKECRDHLGAVKGQMQSLDLNTPAAAFPDRYDLRSARVRAMLAALFDGGMCDKAGRSWSAQEVSALLLEQGPDAFSIICSRVESRELRISPANRILDLRSGVRGQAKNWLTEVKSSERPIFLVSHDIPTEAFRSLQDGQHDEFLRQRLEALMVSERTFMDARGVAPPVSRTPQAPAIDVEYA